MVKNADDKMIALAHLLMCEYNIKGSAQPGNAAFVYERAVFH